MSISSLFNAPFVWVLAVSEARARGRPMRGTKEWSRRQKRWQKKVLARPSLVSPSLCVSPPQQHSWLLQACEKKEDGRTCSKGQDLLCSTVDETPRLIQFATAHQTRESSVQCGELRRETNKEDEGASAALACLLLPQGWQWYWYAVCNARSIYFRSFLWLGSLPRLLFYTRILSPACIDLWTL
jgi:hypothetical protein